MQTNRLKKGDTVKIIAGREKGKTGKVTKILADGKRVVIEKLNMIKRHQRPDQKSKGGIMEKEAPLDRLQCHSRLREVRDRCPRRIQDPRGRQEGALLSQVQRAARPVNRG